MDSKTMIMTTRIISCLLITALMAAKVDGAEISIRFLEGNEAKKSMTGRQAAIGESSGAPVIDGKGDEEFWKNAAVLTGFALTTGGKPQARTEAKLARDATNLYVLIECEEPQMDKIKAECKEHDGEVWRDDVAELFLAPKNDPAEYYQIMINSLGTVAESRCCALVNGEQNYDPRWNPEIETAVVRGEKQWSVEIRIPFRELTSPQESALWGLNICRERRAGNTENSTWSQLIGTFHQPELFGCLAFVSSNSPMINKCEYGTDWGWNRLAMETRGGTGLNLTAKLANETAPDWYEAKSAVAADGRAETLIRAGTGRHRMQIDACDVKNKRLLRMYQTFKPRELMTCTANRLLFCGEPLNGSVNLGISPLSLNEVALTIRLTDSRNRIVGEKKTGGIDSGRIWFECGTEGLPEGIYDLTIILHDQTGRLPLMQWREPVSIVSGY